MNSYRFDEIEVGLKASFERTITTEMETQFREITGDDNPLHRDDDYAVRVGEGRFPGHVSFGMLTASLYSTLAGVYLPGEYSLIHSLEDLSFQRPVFAGDTLTVEGEVTEREEALRLIRIKATIRNQNGKVVSKARMKVLVLQ